tara:strand:+ start:20 stop:598 length:579 start_codon:yes stop_codon:yes gene_type:complete
MSRARDNANLGAQAGSGLDASDITSGTLGNTVQDNITRLGTVTTGTMSNTIGTSATITTGHFKASSSNSFCMFYHLDLASGVAHNAYWPWTSIWTGHGGGYHLWMSGHASYPSSGLNFVAWRTGFSHNGSALYEYGRDSNNGAHLAGPHFQLSGSGVTQLGQIRFQNISGGSSMAMGVGIMIVSNVALKAPA